MSLIKIKDYPQYVKDDTTNAVLNNDLTALNEYKIKKQLQTNINTINTEMENIKSDISEIKSLLLALTKIKE